jgi:hypothetical protein
MGTLKKKNSVALVRERTIPNERRRMSKKLVQNIVDRGFSRPEPLLFLPSSSSFVFMWPSGPRSRPTTSQKI